MPSTDALPPLPSNHTFGYCSSKTYNFLGGKVKTKTAHNDSTTLSIALKDGPTGVGIMKTYLVTVRFNGKGAPGRRIVFEVDARTKTVALKAMALLLANNDLDFLSQTGINCSIDVETHGNRLEGKITDLTDGAGGAVSNCTINDSGLINVIKEIARKARIGDSQRSDKNLSRIAQGVIADMERDSVRVRSLSERVVVLRGIVKNGDEEAKKEAEKELEKLEPGFRDRFSGVGQGSTVATLLHIKNGGLKEAWKKQWSVTKIAKALKEQREKAAPIRAQIANHNERMDDLSRAFNDARAGFSEKARLEAQLNTQMERLDELKENDNYLKHLQIQQLNKEIAQLEARTKAFKVKISHRFDDPKKLKKEIADKKTQRDKYLGELPEGYEVPVEGLRDAETAIKETQRQIQAIDYERDVAETAIKDYFDKHLKPLMNSLERIEKKIKTLRVELKKLVPND